MTGSDRPSLLFRAMESARRRMHARRLERLAVLLACFGLTMGAAAFDAAAAGQRLAAIDAASARLPDDEADAALRIAVAPFEGERVDDEAAIARQLTNRIGRLGVDRLIAPGSFVAEGAFDPRAELVRGWADLVAVDTVIVGRVLRPEPRSALRVVEAVARSGHSGAELFRHAVRVPLPAGLGASLDQLAVAIVRGLGGNPSVPTEVEQSPLRPPVSANADAEKPSPASSAPASAQTTTGAAEPAAGAPSTTGLAADWASGSSSGSADDSIASRFRVESFDSDAPIEIHADAAEILVEGETRKIVFQGSVSVQQDDVTIRSERLEAEYPAGESEPSRLLARGAVHVAQGNRSARCDRAEYLRSDQSLTCRGHAELVQGCDVVRGERIVLDFGGGRARVEGAASILISPKRNASGACSPAAQPAPKSPGARP